MTKAGNDHLKAGGGPSVLLGGGGDDELIGGNARNILIGGSGADFLQGQADEDLLIGGATLFDDNDAALLAMLREWNSSRTFAQRVANLRGEGTEPRENEDFFLLPDVTYFDDDAEDLLSGGPDSDWLLNDADDEVILGNGDLQG